MPSVALIRQTRLHGCLTGPALERVVKSAGLLIAKKPSHFGSWQVVFMQITCGEIKSQTIENFAKRVSFRREAARQRSLAYAEPLSNLRHFRPAMRQQWGNGVLDVQSPGARPNTMIGDRFFAVLYQKGIEVRIGIADRCVFERLSIRNLIDGASEYDLAAKERLKSGWQVGATMYEFDGDRR